MAIGNLLRADAVQTAADCNCVPFQTQRCKCTSKLPFSAGGSPDANDANIEISTPDKLRVQPSSWYEGCRAKGRKTAEAAAERQQQQKGGSRGKAAAAEQQQTGG